MARRSRKPTPNRQVADSANPEHVSRAAVAAAPPQPAAERPEPGGTVRITLPDGRTRHVPRNTPARVALQQARIEAPYPVVAVMFRNKVNSLDRPLDKPGSLEPVHLGTRDGALIYRRSLTFVLIRAVADLYPDLRVYINHSIAGGYYAELYAQEYARNGAVQLSPEDVRAIEKRMRDIAEADEPIERHEHTVEEAIEIFREAGMMDKVELLRYSTSGPVSIYRLGNRINHFYGQLAPSTGCLKYFELAYEAPGLILRFPGYKKPEELMPMGPHDKMLGVLREYERWMRILDWRSVPRLNMLIETNKVREYVLIAEALHEKRLAAIADTITNHPRKPRIVLLSGPSASGKTTSIKRLSIHLRVNGLRPLIIELDDFFVDREKTPLDEKGEFDFEAFHAIDLQRLQDSVSRLLKGEKVALPKFDFQQGRSVPGDTVRLEPDQILVLEGIHALNDELLPTIPHGMKFRIYASPLTHLNIDDHNRISSSDVRLLRRLVRDFNYRGYDAVQTIQRWPSVRRGEEVNIFPYQENADVIFNSSLPYELSALKPYALKVLQRVKPTHAEYSEAARLIKFLGYFRGIRTEYVPRHSLLREFIGGSCFTY